MLLSQTIDNIALEISELLAIVEAKKVQQSTLIELDAKADDLLEQMGELVSKVKYHAPDEINSLRNAVLNLFDGDDDNNDLDHQTTALTPKTDLEAETSLIPETALEADTFLTAETTVEVKTVVFNEPIQDSTTIVESTQKESTYIELVQHPNNEAIAYQRKHDSEIICVYLGCNSVSRLKSWSEWLYRQDWGLTRQECNNSRQASRLTKFKYELKLPALSWKHINQLVKRNFSKPPKKAVDSSKTTDTVSIATSLASSSSHHTKTIECKFESAVGDQLGIALAG